MSLFLRTTDKDGKSYGGFQWPMEVGATVTAPDWEPTSKCGNGLHGILDGLGQSGHLSFEGDAIWWIVEADDAIDIWGKYKFQTCKVVTFGPRYEVTAQLYALRPGPIHGLVLTGGYGATLTGGYAATLIGGDRATLTGGYGATLTGGNEATLIGGNLAILIGGDLATLTGGNGATLTGGRGATLTGGLGATLTGGIGATLIGGDWATLTGGNEATLTGGYSATLTGGDQATLTGGNKSTLIFLRWLDNHRRVLTAYVGENGILPGVAYRANADHTGVEAVELKGTTK